jgi:hypothetical protein
MRQVVENDPVSPRLLNASVPRDLETICLKCLEKESHRRYATARALSEDLDRFLRDEPIRARATRPAEIWSSAVFRRAVSSQLSDIFVTGGFAACAVRRRRERRAPTSRAGRARASSGSRGILGAAADLYASDVSFVAQALRRGDLGLARRTLAACAESRRRGFARLRWRYLWSQCQGDQLATIGTHDWIVTCIFADGKLATGAGKTVKIWDGGVNCDDAQRRHGRGGR